MKTAFLALAVGLTGPAFAEDPPTELQALEERFEESELPTVERFSTLKPEFLALADRLGATDEALSARLWVLRRLYYERQAGTMEESAAALAATILEVHGDSPRLDEVAQSAFAFSAEVRADVFAKLLESPHDAVKAAALYAMARGERANQELRAGHFRELLEAYGELPYRDTTYGEIADANLNPHPASALEIGQVAPDIVGTDGDGAPIKLSDYRGKVVVLDFWGDW